MKEKKELIELRQEWKHNTFKMLTHYNSIQLINMLADLVSEKAEWGQEHNSAKGFQEAQKYHKDYEKKQTNIYEGKVKKEIKSLLKITNVAKKYGLKVRGSKVVCPFHNDRDPSLSLNDQKNVFHCFGCKVKGDILTFIMMMEEQRKKEENDKPRPSD